MFEEVLRRRAGANAARRGAWILGSTVAQVALLAAIASFAAARAARSAKEPVVEVRLLKRAAEGLRLPAAAPLTPPRRAPKPVPPKEPGPRRAATAMIQPKELPAEVPLPRPEEPPEPAPEGEGGVVGGARGGGAEAGGGALAPAPPARREFDASTMKRPVFRSGPELAYTPAALERGVEGLIVVKCVITVQGLVRECRVLKSLPSLDAAVVDALEHRVYEPARLGGEPVEVDYVFKVNLRLPR
ncbi:MAG TPA: energy transducer TonB [Anaeromyxobacteraceae bacterium]|nr:energy transducer TonB [Anaeromyxobacteraceae bacterium]